MKRNDDLPDEPGDRLAYSHGHLYKDDEFIEDLLDSADAERG